MLVFSTVQELANFLQFNAWKALHFQLKDNHVTYPRISGWRQNQRWLQQMSYRVETQYCLFFLCLYSLTVFVKYSVVTAWKGPGPQCEFILAFKSYSASKLGSCTNRILKLKHHGLLMFCLSNLRSAQSVSDTIKWNSWTITNLQVRTAPASRAPVQIIDQLNTGTWRITIIPQLESLLIFENKTVKNRWDVCLNRKKWFLEIITRNRRKHAMCWASFGCKVTKEMKYPKRQRIIAKKYVR